MRCLRTVYRVCGAQALLPTSLQIPLCYDPLDIPECSGGFADVWKCPLDGREVAAKGLKVYLTTNFERIRRVGSPWLAVFISELIASCAEVLQGGSDLENPPPSECVASVRCDHD